MAPRSPQACTIDRPRLVLVTSLGAPVVGIGDSIMTSSCTTGQVSGFGICAGTTVSTPELPVSYFNEGYPGRNSKGFCSCGIWDIEHLRPQVALIQTWSGNEPWTQDMADLSFARAMSVVDAGRRIRCVPILVTPPPVFANSPEAEAHRQRNRARAWAAAQAGAYLLDLDALWGTGSTPNAYRHEYDWGDHMHPNDTACAVAARALAPMLREILGAK